MKMDIIGSWVFLIGLILAIIIAVLSATNVPTWAVVVLAIIGLIVGIANVTDAEAHHFLIAGIAFLLSFQALSGVITELALGWLAVSTFFSLLSIFIAPAIAIVALKVLYDITKDA